MNKVSGNILLTYNIWSNKRHLSNAVLDAAYEHKQQDSLYPVECEPGSVYTLNILPHGGNCSETVFQKESNSSIKIIKKKKKKENLE